MALTIGELLDGVTASARLNLYSELSHARSGENDADDGGRDGFALTPELAVKLEIGEAGSGRRAPY